MITPSDRLSALCKRLGKDTRRSQEPEPVPAGLARRISQAEAQALSLLPHVTLDEPLLDAICATLSEALFFATRKHHPERLADILDDGYTSAEIFSHGSAKLMLAALDSGMDAPQSMCALRRGLACATPDQLERITRYVFKWKTDPMKMVIDKHLSDQVIRHCTAHSAPTVAGWLRKARDSHRREDLLRNVRERLRRPWKSNNLKFVAVHGALGLELGQMTAPESHPLLGDILLKTSSAHGRLSLSSPGLETLLATSHRDPFYSLVETPGHRGSEITRCA